MFIRNKPSLSSEIKEIFFRCLKFGPAIKTVPRRFLISLRAYCYLRISLKSNLFKFMISDSISLCFPTKCSVWTWCSVSCFQSSLEIGWFQKKENWQQELLMSPKANSYSARLIEIVQSSAIVSVELDKLCKSQIRFGVKKKR